MSNEPSPKRTPPAADNLKASLAAIEAALGQIRFGTVSLTLHEGRVVQIDVTEKKRLDRE
jgi:hypothetical protein